MGSLMSCRAKLILYALPQDGPRGSSASFMTNDNLRLNVRRQIMGPLFHPAYRRGTMLAIQTCDVTPSFFL